MPALLDHIGVVGPDLAAMEAAYARLGFRVAPRCELLTLDAAGRTATMGQVNSHLVFDDTYVELTAVHGDLATHHLRDAIARYWGLHILVLRSEDATREQRRLVAAGSAAPAPALAARQVAYPGGEGVARFRWFRIPDAEFPEAFLCEVEHLDAALVFDRQFNTHPNGARALRSVTVLADRPAEAAGRLGRVAGAAPRQSGGGWTIDCGGARIDFADAAGIADRFPGVTAPAAPWVAAFGVVSHDLDKTAHHLERAGLALYRDTDRLWTSPEDGCGAIVEFLGA